jgi:ribosome-associated translation inhibitor RaiA
MGRLGGARSEPEASEVHETDPNGGRMSEDAVVMISFKDLETDEELREKIEVRCRSLAAEFPETTRFEITIAPDGAGHVTHARVNGRQTHIDAHAVAIEMALSAEGALDKVHHQLRSVHDKRIFARRREARRDSPKRGT